MPNDWIAESYAARSGGIDRLVTWIGADPLLFAWAEFIERRIVQHLPASTCGRMFAVLERDAGAEAYRQPLMEELALCDERGPAVWHAELEAHAQHEPNRAFAIAFVLAAWPLRLPGALRGVLPDVLVPQAVLISMNSPLGTGSTVAHVGRRQMLSYRHVKFREVRRILKDDGWFKVSQTGSHEQWKHPVSPAE